jgi:hypothetical protein
MRIPASVLKGIRIGLSGTSLALAVGCNTPSSPVGSDAPITRETPAVAPANANANQGTALDRRTQDPVATNRAETAPPSSPFLVDPSAAQAQPMQFGEVNEPASVTIRRSDPLPQVQSIAAEQPIKKVGAPNNQGWRARACGRG